MLRVIDTIGVVFRTGSSYIGVANIGSHKEKRMGKLIAGLMALALALSSVHAVACSVDRFWLSFG